jgi:predicted DNA-binding transcriptional regulator YafY
LAKSDSATIIIHRGFVIVPRLGAAEKNRTAIGGAMARNEQLIRQHKILQILERVRFGKTLDELQQEVVDELGLNSLHPRTLRRDLEALQAAGIDVDVHDEVRGKVWKLGPRHNSDHRITATASELIALSLGRQLLHPLAGTPFWMGIESFWNKIRDELPATVLEHYEKFSRSLRVSGIPTKSYERHHGIIKTINRAILEHRVVEIIYASLDKAAAERRIEPYAIVLFQSSLYVIAADHELPAAESAARVRTWKIDRFEKATLLDQWFKVPEDLDVDQFMAHSLGVFFGHDPQVFRIRLSPQAARLVLEDPWHQDQSITKLDSGEFELVIKAVNEVEIIQRVLSMGSEAEIVEPESTRDAMRRIVDRLSSVYGVGKRGPNAPKAKRESMA